MVRLLTVGGRVSFGLFIVWVAWAFLRPILERLGHKWTQAGLGAWGDSFGALNTLFTALGFSAVVATLWLQQKQNDAAEADQHRQRFEGSFFELLKLLREARDEVRFIHSEDYAKDNNLQKRREYQSHRAFRHAWREIEPHIYFENSSLLPKVVGMLYDEHVHDRYESNFGPYFRLIYTILYRTKHDKVLSFQEKAQYGNLLRTQITSYELSLVGLNGLSVVSKDFKLLITEFRMLKYLPKDSDRRRLLEKYYDQEAFKARDDDEVQFNPSYYFRESY